MAATIVDGREHHFVSIWEGTGKGQRVGNFIPFTDDGTISNSVILEGAKIGADSVLENCLIGIGAKVPEGTELFGEIVDHSVL